MFIWNANIIFSRMSIIFFSDAGNVIFKCIYQEKVIFSSFDGRIISCLLEKKYHLYVIYRKHHISMYFLRKIIFHFSSIEKKSYFREKKMPSSLMIQERSYSTAIFLERASFQNIWRKYNISTYFLRQIVFHFTSKE